MRPKLLQKLSPLKLRGRPSGVGLLLLLACCGANDASAFNISGRTPIVVTKVFDTVITGQVNDEKGQPLPGVTVRLQNSQLGTVTDVNGKFRISIPDGQTNRSLTFTFIGFVTQTVNVGQQAQVTVTLKADMSKALNEVVVVGYGTQRRATINGAIGTVGARDINEKPVLNAVQALQGESPNLIIQQSTLDPGATPLINIRGVSTTGNNDPLLVIDGIISQSPADLSLLNPNDIASVTVLKDAGAAAIFG